MAEKRMVARRLWDSKRAAKLSDRAFAQYIMELVFSDVLGRLEDDGESLLACARRRGIVQGWTPADMEATQQEIRDSGLLKSWSVEGQPYSEIDKFNEVNKVREDREGKSKIPEDSRRTPGVVPEDSTTVLGGGLVLDGGGGRGEVFGTTLLSINGGKPVNERSRIATAWTAAHPGQVPPVTPVDSEEARKAADLGTCARWPDTPALTAEMLRTRDGLKAKGFNHGLKSVLNHLGEEWGPSAKERSAAQVPNGQPVMPTLAEACPWVLEEHPALAAERRRKEAT